MSQEKTSFVYVTYIRSTPQKVFDAIILPEPGFQSDTFSWPQ